MAIDTIQVLVNAMQVAKAQHQHTAEQIAKYNNIDVGSLSRVDFNQVLNDSLELSDANLDKLISKHSRMVSRDSISLDQLTAEALDTSGRYNTLTETLNRHLGLMSIAVVGQER